MENREKLADLEKAEGESLREQRDTSDARLAAYAAANACEEKKAKSVVVLDVKQGNLADIQHYSGPIFHENNMLSVLLAVQ